ncbi:migration and invasion-inhibitory protein [Tachyglossus aculeatus]|uniref:migration and invasion-inhibitory protein n=1 Tax=Tachyglossus aculeatus TaxID=9261 RepID=UPI0018F3A1D4|nr:migration and invasion-inhibitory protein [Tachyglossus aculeatus]
MLASEQLARLRRANQDLLRQLWMKQEEIRKQVPRSREPSEKPLGLGTLHEQTASTEERHLPDPPRKEKENGIRRTKDAATVVSMEAGAQTARILLCSPPRCSWQEGKGERRERRPSGSDPDPTGPELSRAPAPRGRQSKPHGDGVVRSSGCPENSLLRARSRPPASGESGRPLMESCSALQKTPPGAGDPGHRLNPGRCQEARPLKSILVTPQTKDSKKEPSRVAFRMDSEEFADSEELTVPEDSWPLRPYLGYDWIAGLLDLDSSISEKSERFFSELHEFRQANKEECVYAGPEQSPLDISIAGTEEEPTPGSHQCIHCYKVNQRLFAVPVHPEASCPVCKTPRAQRPPETLEEPAYIRVTIPRSTFLAPHRYHVHRRKSFEATDTLALPPHCQLGWENSVPLGSSTLSSLDLWAALDPSATSKKPPDPSHPSLAASSVVGNSRSDQLLDPAQLSSVARFWRGGLGPPPLP